MFVTIVVGELAPKALALRHAAHIALAGTRGRQVLERALLPMVDLLAWVTSALVARISPAPFTAASRAPAPVARQRYALDLVVLATRRVRDAMIPWAQTVTADVSMRPQPLTDMALASGHTRLPVLSGREVNGILHTKELLMCLAAGERDWRTLVRPAVTVGPEDPLLSVLRLLQARQSHMGIVMGPDGVPLGIVTLEDILEEVLGDLYDEDDDRAVERLMAARGKLKDVALRPDLGRPGRTPATGLRTGAPGGANPKQSNEDDAAQAGA